MPGATRILRLQRTDEPKEHILLRVDQASATRPLDLKLIATEHEHLYHGDIKSGNILSLKAGRYSGDEDELRDIFYYCFLQDEPDGATASNMQGLEMVAAIEKNAVVLTIRRNVGDIKTRIANVQLGEDDEREAVSPFEWVDLAVSISDDIRQQTTRLKESLAAQCEESDKLSKQLDEFLRRKKENEEEMLKKFAALLNTKKRKIRELQSQLGGHVHTSNRGAGSKGKRKAHTEQHLEDDVVMDDADADVQAEDEEDEETPTTPPATDDEGNEMETLHTQGSGSNDIVDLPPRRELPFAQRQAALHKSGHSQDIDRGVTNDEEDETDDEL